MTYKWFKDLCLALERTFHSLPPRFSMTTMITPGASSPVTFYFPPLLKMVAMLFRTAADI